MTKPQNLKVIVGLGKTGLSCVRYLVKQGFPVTVTDSRLEPPGLNELKMEFPQVPISLGGFDRDLLNQAQEMIVSPGIPLYEPTIAKAIKHGIPAVGDIELFARHVKAPIVGITGTNGKSTVTALVGEMAQNAGLRVGVGGNLGTPALDLITATESDLYVLELSSFQLETTHSLQTTTATVLNITPDHMDRYHDFAAYVAAKQRIYQQHCRIPVINRDDPVSYSGLANRNNAISFGMNEPKSGEFGLRVQDNKTYLAFGDKNLLDASAMMIKGRHQMANALAALALGSAIQLPLPTMLETLKTFKGLAHRCQWVRKINAVDWYNDSKGTNVTSSLAGIEGLGSTIDGKLILIAGGLGKQQDFSPLHDAVAKNVRTVILIGQDAKIIAAALEGANKIIFAKSLAEAVTIAKREAQAGDAVLLSPACASFDMFNNFEHRGEVFMELVRNL